MPNLKAAAAQMQHVGAMTKAREDAASIRARNPFQSPSTAPGSSVDNLADAISRLMEQHAREVVRDRPEWIRDRDIMREYFGGCSRAHYWKIMKQPDFPKARQISPRIRVRNRFEIEQWLAEREQVT